jgi:hypothetical protein
MASIALLYLMGCMLPSGRTLAAVEAAARTKLALPHQFRLSFLMAPMSLQGLCYLPGPFARTTSMTMWGIKGLGRWQLLQACVRPRGMIWTSMVRLFIISKREP